MTHSQILWHILIEQPICFKKTYEGCISIIYWAIFAFGNYTAFPGAFDFKPNSMYTMFSSYLLQLFVKSHTRPQWTSYKKLPKARMAVTKSWQENWRHKARLQSTVHQRLGSSCQSKQADMGELGLFLWMHAVSLPQDVFVSNWSGS